MPPKKVNKPKVTLKDFSNEFIGTEAQTLMKRPKRLKQSQLPHFNLPTANTILQLDTLYFPETNSEYKYVLVACDVATNKVDAEPMKLRDANTITLAFKNIIKRKIIQLPRLVMCDRGSEFKAQFLTFLKQHKIGRQLCQYHRQLLPVDHICFILGKYLGGAILNEEIKTGNLNTTAWKKHLSKLIKILNDGYTKEPVDPATIDPSPNESGNLLDIGQKVKLLLNNPINYLDGSKLHGKFRASDIRWSKEDYVICQVHINPSQRVLYTVKDDKNRVLHDCAFVREHLLLV
jgi:hypothetical protein